MDMNGSKNNTWLHCYATFVAFVTFLLFVAGALVTSNDASLSVPDWPTTFGSFRMPRMIGGGLIAGLRHQEAARFSFLLATPIIGAAGVLEIPQLLSATVPLAEYVAAAVLAGLAAYLSARFLLRYFRSGRLDPYGWYCAAAGAISLALLTFRP